MNALIIYYSHTKNNERLAHVLEWKLRCDTLKIEELKTRNGFTIMLDLVFNRHPAIETRPVRLQNYEQIILAAPIWAGRIASPIKTFLLNEKRNITSYSFITVCGIGGQERMIAKQLTSMLGKAPVAVAELPLDDLPPSENGKKRGTHYQVTYQDFDHFKDRIASFLAANQIPDEQKLEVA